MKKFLIIQTIIIISAFLTSFSAPSFDLFFLAWFTFIPVLFVLENTSPPKALLIGLEYGLIINLHSFYWLKNTIVIFGNLPLAVAFILYTALSFLQGIRYGVFFYIYKKFNLKDKNILLFPLIYSSLEYFFPMLFNWTLGNTQYKFLPFIQIVDIFGISFLSFVMALFNILAYKSVNAMFYNKNELKKLKKQFFAFAIFFSVIIIYGFIQIYRYNRIIKESPKLKIGVVQPNIAIFDVHNPQKFKENLNKLKHQSLLAQKEGAELIIWPESSSYSSKSYDVKKINIAPYLNVPLIFGGISYKMGKKGYFNYNTAFFIDENRNVLNTYHKQYLLAFGEYMPFGEYFPDWKKYFAAVGNFKPGKEIKVFNFKNKAKLGILICYEDIIETFSNKVNKLHPNILINMSNDAWFGKTAAPDLHRMIAQYRTIENRVPLVRVTNTGRTVFIDPLGRLVKSLPIYQSGHLTKEVPIMKSKTLYQLFGFAMPYIYLLLIIFILFYDKNYPKGEI